MEAWRQHGTWIRSVDPDLAANIRVNFESASRITDAARDRAMDERRRLLATLAPSLAGDV